MCPKPDLWPLARECYLVSFTGEDEDVMDFKKVPFSALEDGDLFTLEASAHPDSHLDPIYGLVAVERIYRAVAAPYHVDNVWQIEAERI